MIRIYFCSTQPRARGAANQPSTPLRRRSDDDGEDVDSCPRHCRNARHRRHVRSPRSRQSWYVFAVLRGPSNRFFGSFYPFTPFYALILSSSLSFFAQSSNRRSNHTSGPVDDRPREGASSEPPLRLLEDTLEVALGVGKAGEVAHAAANLGLATAWLITG